MQLGLPFLTPPPPEPRIEIVRVRRARRYILRVRPDGTVRVTIPRGGSRAAAMQFVERNLHWVLEEQLRVAAQHGARRWGHGSVFLLHGEPVTIAVRPGGRTDSKIVRYDSREFEVDAHVGDLRPYVEADLRSYAHEQLVPRLYELADQHGLCVAKVTIRNQRSRWGSCSPNGAIALNFRLVQMPPEVCDYVLVHELMHLKEQNHGRRYWRLVEAAFPNFRAAELWLKTEGRALF